MAAQWHRFPHRKDRPPLHLLRRGVPERSPGNPAGGFQPENSLSREETLRSITLWAAKASFEEGEKGSLEPGKWADFVVLDTDLMKASPKRS